MKDENKKSMKDYIKCYSAVLILVLVFLMLGVSLWVTYARYQTTVDSQLSIDVASLIIETKIDTIDGNLARGKNVTRYFTIQNFNDTETTEIAYDYYIYIVDENDEIIPNAKVYEYKKVESENLITQDNPNSYIEIEEDSQYIGGYYGGEFFLDQESKEFKLEVTNVQTEEIRVKTVAVQKEVI